MLAIVLTKSYLYLRSQGFEVLQHAHLAVQVSLAEPDEQLLFEGACAPGLMIDGDYPHALDPRRPLHSFLISPVHPLNRSLRARLDGFETFVPPAELTGQLSRLTVGAANRSQLDGLFEQLMSFLCAEPERVELDARIEEVVAHMDALEEKRVAAGELAERISLSQSRFLHLFKAELAVTVRSYLLWLRTLEAARLVAAGRSNTEAAHHCGFTDSAHLARAFKKMFGVTLSSIFAGVDPPTVVA